MATSVMDLCVKMVDMKLDDTPMEVDGDVNNASPMDWDDHITDVKVNGMELMMETKVVISVCHRTTGTTGLDSNVHWHCETSFASNVTQ